MAGSGYADLPVEQGVVWLAVAVKVVQTEARRCLLVVGGFLSISIYIQEVKRDIRGNDGLA